uniref:Uncharacterized protein n=1 Tax=Anguilla anguilla TaxID=7936 RepID=A0A0E9X5Y5_ANGAN
MFTHAKFARHKPHFLGAHRTHSLFKSPLVTLRAFVGHVISQKSYFEESPCCPRNQEFKTVLKHNFHHVTAIRGDSGKHCL